MPYFFPLDRTVQPLMCQRLLRVAVFAGLLSPLGSLAQTTIADLERAPAPVIAAGDVGTDSAVLWVQANRPGTLLVELAPPDGSDAPPRQFQLEASAESDFTVKMRVDGLTPDTTQRWRAALVTGAGQIGDSARGEFRTAPTPFTAASVQLAWGADLGGQNVCRDAERGFEVFGPIVSSGPDLFVALGDMIYADGLCEAVGRYGNAQVPASFGQATDLSGFRAHWRYSRADPGLRRLLANTAYYAVWDDHEVVNDFGPLHDTRADRPYRPGVHLMPLGLKALLEQNPIGEDPLTPKRLYRSVRWGQHLELLLLDTRQYRDANLAPDSAERPKTLLGREQLTWLNRHIADSDATWLVVASSVPLAIPTGSPSAAGRDGWANFDQQGGFEQELRAILDVAAASRRKNLVFISADAHFAAAFRYRPFTARPEFSLYELVTSPLSAAVGDTADYDRDLGTEQLFRHAPASAAEVSDYSEARRWFGFGEIGIDTAGELTATLRGVDGKPWYSLRLTPSLATRLATRGVGTWFGTLERPD